MSISSCLDKEEFVPFAPDEAGGQIHINHADCPAGEDTKQRLYIKRCEDGITILAFCHHCRKRGKYNSIAATTIETAKRRYKHSGSQRSLVRSKSCRIPECAEYDLNKWPSKARAWLYRYGITSEEIREYGLFYNPTNLRVGIPTFTKQGVSSIQYRQIFTEYEDTDSPKYYTVKGECTALMGAGVHHSGTTCVLTEDAVSAIRCGRVMPAYALTGTYLTDEELQWLLSRSYKHFILFLDDDNPDVRMQELILKNRLDVFGSCRIIHTDRDPKEYSDEELKLLLC